MLRGTPASSFEVLPEKFEIHNTIFLFLFYVGLFSNGPFDLILILLFIQWFLQHCSPVK